MKRIVAFLGAALALVAQPTVSGVRTDFIYSPNGEAPHSFIRVMWNLSAAAGYHRILYGLSGGAGLVYSTSVFVLTPQQNDMGFPISGLAPATTYYFQAQSSYDGSTWSSGGTGSFTTAALPAVHPEPPQISGLWNPTFPNTAGYLAVAFNSSCIEVTPVSGNTLAQAISAAVTLQPTQGTLMTFPHGITCSLPNIQLFPNDTQSLTVPQSTGVNTSTGALTYNNSVSGWTPTNGQTVMVTSSLCLPGSVTTGNGDAQYNGSTQDSCGSGTLMNGPFVIGQIYNIVGVSGGTFKLSASPGGSPIIPADTGSSGATMYISQWPLMNSNWTVFQTDTPDSTFCPFGVRCMDSIWGAKKVTFQVTGGNWGTSAPSSASMTGPFTHNLWFRGIRFTSTDVSSLASSSLDPKPSAAFFSAPYTNRLAFAVLDRSSIVCQPFPNRCTEAIPTLGGSNLAVINSDLENLHYYRPSVSPGSSAASPGLQGTQSGQTVTFNPGVANLGIQNTCTNASPISVTITGGTSSTTAYVYLTAACVPTLVLPTGMTATTTGTVSDSSSVAHSWSVQNTASPGWLFDGSGGYNCFQIGTISLSSGTITAYSSTASQQASAWLTEGAQSINGGWGPGPISLLNNYWDATGIPFHFDDSSVIDPQQVWIRQNYFFYNPAYMTGSATSNGLRYKNRNGIEFKHGRQIKYEGNQCYGAWMDVTSTGACFLAHIANNQGTTGSIGGCTTGTCVAGYPAGFTIQDVDVLNNTFSNGHTALQFGSGIASGNPTPAAARIRVQNNLIAGVNGFTQIDANSTAGYLGQGTGGAMEIDGSIQDFIFKNNTLYDNRGYAPLFLHVQAGFPMEGCQVQNNVFWFNGSTSGMTTEQQQHAPVVGPTPNIYGTGGAVLNLDCTSGPGNPSVLMTNNVAVPYYSNPGPGAPSGLISDSGICTSWLGTWGSSCTGGYFSLIPAGASAPANLAIVGFQSPAVPIVQNVDALNLLLLSSSAYKSGSHLTTDGGDMGVNIIQLLTAQGAVAAPGVKQIGTASATVTFWAYDGTIGCPIDYAAAPNDASTQTGGGRAASTAVNNQSVLLTGLTPNQAYNFRVLCPVNQPTGSFTTQ